MSETTALSPGTVLASFEFLRAPHSGYERLGRSIPVPATGGVLIPSVGQPAESLSICWDVRSAALDVVGRVSCTWEVEARTCRVVCGPATRPSCDVIEGIRALCTWAHDTLWPDEILVDAPAFASLLSGAAHFVKSGASYRFRKVETPGAETILTAGPSISERECSYALDAARTGWNRSWSGYLERFEAAFADYVGCSYALPTSSCTGALHIALAALGIGPGDEVIVPDITWVATANAVLYVGATPIFADVDAASWCLDPVSFESCITPKTRAVMPVHLYGHPCDMDPILAIAEKHGLYVVEDAAPSIGAEYRGRRTGSFGHFAGFSFQGAKLAVTGEGGMLVTNDASLYRRARQIWDQGRQPGTFWITERGLKYKMSNVQAAIGLAQLERNDSMVAAKRRIFGWYRDGLREVACLRLNEERPWARSIYWMTSGALSDDAPLDRNDLIARLKERNIDSRPVFPAISQYPIWPRSQPPQPTAKRIGDRALNLPSGVCLSREEVVYICATLRELLG